jgi:hypothetical protein
VAVGSGVLVMVGVRVGSGVAVGVSVGLAIPGKAQLVSMTEIPVKKNMTSMKIPKRCFLLFFILLPLP